MKKRIIASLLMGMMAMGIFTGCNNSKPVSSMESDKKISLTFATNGTDLATDTLIAHKFAELVDKETNGQVEIKVFSNDQLSGGNQAKGIEMLSQGTVDMAMYSLGTLSILDQKLATASLPWTFDNYEQVEEIFDTTGGEYIKKLLEPKNIVYLSSAHNAFRQVTNGKKTIKTPEDLKGLKIRIPGGSVYMDTFREFGADPISMSWSEVFTALQQGTIDGQENGLSTINSANVYEVQKYLTMWNYIYDGYPMLISEKSLEKLNPELTKIVQEKAIEACQWGREKLKSDEIKLKDKFKEFGVEITELDSEELKAFKKVVEPLVEKYKEKYGQEAMDAFGIK